MTASQASVVDRTTDFSATKRMARIAGSIYLVFAVISVVAFLYLPGTVIVPGKATATAINIAASPILLRLAIFLALVSQISFIVLVVTLYRLFREVGPWSALLMLALVVVGVAATYANMFNRIAALVILSGADFLSVFAKPELDALAYLFLRLYSQGSDAIEVVWGLWLFPFGLLVIRSRFIPKVLGYLLMIAGVGYVLSFVVHLLLPQFVSVTSPLFTVLVIGELPIIVWLAIVGARAPTAERLSSPPTG